MCIIFLPINNYARQSDDDDDDNNNYATTTARNWSKLSWFAVARITNKKRVAVTWRWQQQRRGQWQPGAADGASQIVDGGGDDADDDSSNNNDDNDDVITVTKSNLLQN